MSTECGLCPNVRALHMFRYEHRRHEVRLEEMKKIEELAEAQRRGDRELEMHIRRSVSASNGADGAYRSPNHTHPTPHAAPHPTHLTPHPTHTPHHPPHRYLSHYKKNSTYGCE